MLKRFLACMNTEQRYECITACGAENWDRSELEAVADILSVEDAENCETGELYRRVLAELKSRLEAAA